ncbi:MAG: hypothetical protein ACI3VP_08125, partial [Oscillospiraceae bacterium]
SHPLTRCSAACKRKIWAALSLRCMVSAQALYSGSGTGNGTCSSLQSVIADERLVTPEDRPRCFSACVMLGMDLPKYHMVSIRKPDYGISHNQAFCKKKITVCFFLTNAHGRWL